MTCRPSQRVGDANALPYEASVKYTREEPGGRAFPRVVYQGALWERLVLIVSPKSSAVRILTIDFFGLWEFVR